MRDFFYNNTEAKSNLKLDKRAPPPCHTVEIYASIANGKGKGKGKRGFV